ncbi:MAG: hypothetical protein RBR50_01010 [Candidatus Izemoplasmatales bacterium]|nr:hypothetical protein [Candidatus Izemoplasmatales bacterium]
MSNNFDNNSKGISIECNIHYSTDIAQMDFDDSFSRIDDSVYQYVDFGNISKLDTKDLISIHSNNKKSDLIDLLDYFHSYDYDITWSKNELIDFIYSLDFKELYTKSWSNNNDIENYIKVTKRYEVITSRGYNQGDIADIIIPHKLADIWGIDKKDLMQGLQEQISHFLWDCPINGAITINDVEWNVDEILDDRYEYDKDKIISHIVANSDIEDKELLKSELDKVIPYEIGYN